MFILTGIKESSAEVTIFDTTDNSNEVVSFYVVADSICKKKMKVYGIGRLDGRSPLPADAVVYNAQGVYISSLTARKALYAEYKRRGYSEEKALQLAGFR